MYIEVLYENNRVGFKVNQTMTSRTISIKVSWSMAMHASSEYYIIMPTVENEEDMLLPPHECKLNRNIIFIN